MYEYLDRRYALALYRVAEEKGKVEEIMGQLREVVELIYGNEDMMKLLKHPEISKTKKKDTIERIFKGKVDEGILTFLLILIDKDRILYLREKLGEMEKIHLEKNNTLLAVIKTVVPLIEEERRNLLEKLEKRYNKKVLLKEELDSSLIGGVYVRVGDDVIDGTVKLRLEKMKELMLKAGR
ncbi:MAG: F0F1 ATP synthase subunit delta [Bacillota bacterium]|nr:F0F1 ATP synthase subunit delta [Bacillota bacterium]